MIKRAKKITALLVTVTSTLSIVPAMAATKLGTKDGTIENGIAFKDGKYLYQGYRTDDDESGIYYNGGTKDKKLDDATEIDTDYGKYNDKFVAVEDGSDKYLVDLSTGKITDDDTAEDLTTTAQAKLETKLNKTDRYGNGAGTIGNISKIKNNKFGDVWYEYTATTEAGATLSTTTTSGQAGISYSGYTNQSGTYIDCSNDANIYVYNGTRMVKLESIGDSDTNNGVTVTLKSVQAIKTLAQDDKYIYRLIKVHVDGAKAVGSSVVGVNATPYEDSYYVQKISKSQGDKEKDAYLPRSTDSFQFGLTADMGDSDVNDAFNAVINDSGSSYNYSSNGFEPSYYVVDGSLYTTFKTGEKVKTIKMNLKTSQKLKQGNVTGTSNKIDGHVVVKDTDKDQKVEDQVNSFGVDVNGNVWAIKDGEILESTKCGDFKVVYTVDRSFDSIDVYDENNLLAWEDGGDAYTNVAEGKKQAADDAGALVTPAKVGWEQLSDGTWTFYDATGAKVVNNWANIGGSWYFLDVNGTMATGWQQVNGSWYYLNPISDGTKGAMKTGWLNDNGTWYFLNSSGAMETGWKNINGSWYYLNPNSDGTRGAMKTGWVNDNGTWYYLYSNGSMASNTIINGYKLSSNGALI